MILRGVLPINKPKGLSSYDCIRKIKIVFPNTKLGHAGTLDPLASGLLLILFNEANKIAQYLMNQDKEYVAVIELGKQTDTDDISGQVISQRSYLSIKQNKLVEILQGFLGKQTQIPPKFSALKQNGQRSYILARQGFDFTPKARKIEIKEIELLDFNLPFITIRTLVSKGTYIRALARDIGEHLGCGGTLADLIRTKIGRFELNKAIDLSAIQVETIDSYLQLIN
ncbi:MAG: tRNA pseudouridine(55) synthase TruB, partial [candidate division WOR-3 bacterium]